MHGDDDILVLRSEISRLQMLERGLSRESRAFTLEEEEEANAIQHNARMRKPISILLRLGLFVGMVFVIIVIVRQMENKEVPIPKDAGGTTAVSLEQIRAHNVDDNCWVVFHGNVYDMTSYPKTHSGGRSFITDLCAQDATDMYDAFHPIGLLRTIDRYKIGINRKSTMYSKLSRSKKMSIKRNHPDKKHLLRAAVPIAKCPLPSSTNIPPTTCYGLPSKALCMISLPTSTQEVIVW
jgi:cytochrome b involved in lipid metabolism